MYVVRIEHPITNYEGWKQAFEGDPVGRQQSGVRSYRVLRPIDDPKYVMIDLDFDAASEAAAFLGAMREIWGRVQGTVVTSPPQARIVEVMEAKAY
jgi:hypothetical protein